MKTKFIFSIALVSIFAFNQLSAGCGSCAADKKKTSKAFIEMIPSNGKINGKAFASCGMCNFGMRNRKCSLAIQINDKAYDVKGTKIDDHGDSHAKDGFCNAVRIAKVSGQVKKNVFIADVFELQKQE